MTPNDVSELTPAWFSETLDADVSAVEVLDAHTGTTGRARVRLTSTSSIPETLFVKLQPFTPEQREFVRVVGMGISEARFYATVGEEMPARIPKVWHSSYDESEGTFIMVLEDLEASGCRFPSDEDADVLEISEQVMDELAMLHTAYWEHDLSWLKAPTGMRTGDRGAKLAAEAADAMRSAMDQFADDLPPAFRELGELYVERFVDINGLYRRGERTLVHGDDHMGNLFIDDTGRVGFYDWAIASVLPPARDVAYYLALAVPTEIRRAEQDALIDRYCAGMAKGGVPMDASDVLEQCRIQAMYAWTGCTITAAAGSRWQPFDIGYRAMVRATETLVDLDTVDALTEQMG